MGNGIILEENGTKTNDHDEIYLAFEDEIGQNAEFKAAIETNEYLSHKQIQEYIVPIILKANAAKLTQLRNTIQTNTQIRDLINEFGFQPIDKTLTPIESKKTLGGVARNIGKSGINFAIETARDIANVATEKEKVLETQKKIGETANRIAQKFNSYVIANNDKEYGGGRDYPFFRENEADVFSNSDKVSSAVDDIGRSPLIDGLNTIVTSARSGDMQGDKYVLYLANGEPLTYPTELEKVQDALSRLEKVEEGVDKLIPGLVKKMATSSADMAKDGAFWALDTSFSAIGLTGGLIIALVLAIWKHEKAMALARNLYNGSQYVLNH